MTAHVRVLALDPDHSRVATTSPAIVTGLLKNQLGFKGIVVTDALDMAGLGGLLRKKARTRSRGCIQGRQRCTHDARRSGCKLRAMLEAVRTRGDCEERLDASVLKILRAKASLGLEKDRLVDVAAIPSLVGSPENIAAGQRISDASVTLVRDNGNLLPLRKATP